MTIKNIRRGDGARARWIYAEVYTDDGLLLISATMDYIMERLPQLIEAGE